LLFPVLEKWLFYLLLAKHNKNPIFFTMKKVYLLAILTGLTFYAVAQSKFAAGWIVLNNGDTLSGLIYTKEWNNSPLAVTFKTDKEKKYTIDEVAAFGLADRSVIFRRFLITRHLNPSSESMEYPQNEDSTTTSMQFLELLVPGRHSLYEFSTNRVYFFYEYAKDSVIELQYSNGLKTFSNEAYKNDPRYGKTMLVENPKFRNQILQLATEMQREEYNKRIVNCNYTQQQLTTIFELLNQSKRSDKYKVLIIPGIGAGMGFTQGSVTEGISTGVLARATFNPTNYPIVMFNIEMGSSNTYKKFSVITRLIFSKVNLIGSRSPNPSLEKAVDYQFENAQVDLSAGIRFKFNPRSAVVVFSELGINSQFAAKGTNQQVISFVSSQPIIKEIPYNSFGMAGYAAWGASYKRIVLINSFFTRITHTNYLQGNFASSRVLIAGYYRLKK
jgi:hypothetical protein